MSGYVYIIGLSVKLRNCVAKHDTYYVIFHIEYSRFYRNIHFLAYCVLFKSFIINKTYRYTFPYQNSETRPFLPCYLLLNLLTNVLSFQSDVWSLGCVVYEMCTMKHAFRARDFSGLAYKICTGKVFLPFY